MRVSVGKSQLNPYADLSTLVLDNIPNSGIIAIESAKGTGKTKQIHALVKDSEKAIAGGHRIAR